MDVKGGCCVARYAGNAYDLSRMDRIMLQFRPIAPKPASNGSASGNSDAERSSQLGKRGKRRYVRNKNRKKNDSSDCSTASVTNKCRARNSKKLRSSSSSEENECRVSREEKEAVVTLPLLPETPEREDCRPVQGFLKGVEESPSGFDFDFGSQQQYWNAGGSLWMGGMSSGTVAESWVHVECITETWVNGLGGGMIGWADRGMLMDLERDSYPGFVSDGLEKVVWVNRAYREMTAGQGQGENQHALVWLVMKEGIKLPARGFTCTVRVVTSGKERSSRTLPCDVWRLEGSSGFAWRLDVKAALSLGR